MFFWSITITELQNGKFFMSLVDMILKNQFENRYPGLPLQRFHCRERACKVMSTHHCRCKNWVRDHSFGMFWICLYWFGSYKALRIISDTT